MTTGPSTGNKKTEIEIRCNEVGGYEDVVVNSPVLKKGGFNKRKVQWVIDNTHNCQKAVEINLVLHTEVVSPQCGIRFHPKPDESCESDWREVDENKVIKINGKASKEWFEANGDLKIPYQIKVRDAGTLGGGTLIDPELILDRPDSGLVGSLTVPLIMLVVAIVGFGIYRALRK